MPGHLAKRRNKINENSDGLAECERSPLAPTLLLICLSKMLLALKWRRTSHEVKKDSQNG